MVKLPLLKNNDKLYVQLPDEIVNEVNGTDPEGRVELFKLKNGFYLLCTTQLETALAENRTNQPHPNLCGQENISSDERILIKKLMSIRFENRTPDKVLKTLNETEKVILANLDRKRLVRLFKGKKYAEGVYNIDDKAYAILSGGNGGNGQSSNGNMTRAYLRSATPTQTTGQAHQQVTFQRSSFQSASQYPQSSPSPAPASTNATLNSFRVQGFVIITDAREAAVLSEKLAPEMKRSEIFGMKGFDGKFYVASRSFLTKARETIMPKLKDDMTIDAIATATKLDPDGCSVAMHILAENGEAIEKRKGIFAAL